LSLNDDIININNFQYLINYLPKINSSCELQITNNNDVSIIIKNVINDINENDFLKLKQIINLKYLKIFNKILLNELLSETINNKLIFRNSLSFHQNDENIRAKLYEIIYQNMELHEYIYFIGGEMYIYGIILKKYYHYGYFFSDFESIVNDTIYNLNYHNIDKSNYNVNLVDYDTVKFNYHNDKKMIIINNGKNGLGLNLCYEIIKCDFDKIFIISCNNKSFNQDYEMLKIKYKIIKSFEIKTNYSIWLYILDKILSIIDLYSSNSKGVIFVDNSII
jgi:hypothetical protein